MVEGDSKSIGSNSWTTTLAEPADCRDAAPSTSQVNLATSSYGVVELLAQLDSQLATYTNHWRVTTILSNIGINDSEYLAGDGATWKAAYVELLGKLNAKWPDATIYLVKPYPRDDRAAWDTMAGWIDTLVAGCGYCAAGVDESDLIAEDYADNLHYSAAGQTHMVALWETVLGW